MSSTRDSSLIAKAVKLLLSVSDTASNGRGSRKQKSAGKRLAARLERTAKGRFKKERKRPAPKKKRTAKAKAKTRPRTHGVRIT